MPSSVFDAEVVDLFHKLQQAGSQGTKTVVVDGVSKVIPTPFPSPGDWRDCQIYFLLTDRFNNPKAAPAFAWDQKFGFWQGGKFEGVRQQLPYLQKLGVRAIWISPVVKNSKPEIDGFAFTYPGYNAQDFLNIDERLGSDGTRATAERELTALVDEAHARGIYVILDIVLNHAGRIFDYVFQGHVQADVQSAAVMNAPLGQELTIEWMNGLGFPRADWTDTLPSLAALSADDAVWPTDLQRKEFFRRRGSKLSDTPGPNGFVPGDFSTMRQLVAEYDAGVPGQEGLRTVYGPMPVLTILVRAYEYLIAKYDFDAFRIDTVKYIRPDVIESFGNAVREFALSIGKTNFFTFGEVYDSEDEINKFIGRSGSDTEGFGIDAALDFPLFFVLPNVVKGFQPVEALQSVFAKRKDAERGLISSHGEAGRYFVSFLDNHDQNQRFNFPGMPAAQVSLGVALLFTLQGIPCLYYGTEQGLVGTNNGAGKATLDSNESVREALWGKTPVAFDETAELYKQVSQICAVRSNETPLRYGRLYFREVAGNGSDFGLPTGAGGVIAYSRILTDREVTVVANTSTTTPFAGSVLVDFDLSQRVKSRKIAYSNLGSTGTASVSTNPGRIFASNGVPANISSFAVSLKPLEVQIWTPSEPVW
jgi:glycosidase